AAYLIGFPILKVFIGKTPRGKRLMKKLALTGGGSGWSSGGSRSSGGSSFSGGGGSFSGGGASGSW
ncbi:MAG: YgcG family protein, partial [Ignavibacteria bacterium]|nr:YgcG family protein [Ignavibacteria bacterium]